MRYNILWVLLLLITPLGAHADASSTLTLPEESSTEGETVEIEWHPTEAGTYNITAERVNENGKVVGSETATFVVKALPPPEPEVQGTSTVESSTEIQETLARILPQVAVAEPMFGAIDNLRQQAADALGQGEEWAKAKVTKPQGEVEGESTEKSGGFVDTILQLVATLLLYLFSILKTIVSNAGIFYPVLAVAFLYLLWKLLRRMRRS